MSEERLPEITNDLPKKYKKKRYYVFGGRAGTTYSRLLFAKETISKKQFYVPLTKKNNTEGQ